MTSIEGAGCMRRMTKNRKNDISCRFRKEKRELEARQLWGLRVNIPGKATASFLSLIFALFHSQFQLLF